MDKPLLLQSVKGRIKGAFFEPEVTLTPFLNFLDDLVAIHRLLANQTKEQGLGASL